MGIKNIAIIELMMCTLKPVRTRRPIVQATVIIATIIGARTTDTLRKKTSMSSMMNSAANGAEVPICRNIWWPNVSSAIGSPVMW